MKLALKAHNSYDVRKEYYPLNMESWEKEHKEIEEGYYDREDFTDWVKSDLGIKNLKSIKEILENL